MLGACTLAQGTKWEDRLPYAEFSYNNSFQASLKMSPYEALYGRPHPIELVSNRRQPYFRN